MPKNFTDTPCSVLCYPVTAFVVVIGYFIFNILTSNNYEPKRIKR